MIKPFWLFCLVILVAGCKRSEKAEVNSPSAHQPELPFSAPIRRPTPPEALRILIDIPKLAFAKRAEVSRVLGTSRKVMQDTNMANWSQGTVLTVMYPRAESTFLTGRLVSITYRFKSSAKTAADVLEQSGLPREAAALDRAHSDHLPFRATLNSKNPLSCCGLLFQWVSIPEDRSHIWVNFANINERFADWPIEMRSAWVRAGATPL